MGGYQIADFQKQSLSTTEVTIPGVHAAIDGAGTDKPVLFVNLKIGDNEHPAIYPEISVSGTTYSASCYGGTIAVANDDGVTYTANA